MTLSGAGEFLILWLLVAAASTFALGAFIAAGKRSTAHSRARRNGIR